jgi:hypothetical protein
MTRWGREAPSIPSSAVVPLLRFASPSRASVVRGFDPNALTRSPLPASFLPDRLRAVRR